MIWGALKLTVFVALACAVGFFLSTTQVGGKPFSAQISELWHRPEMKRAVGEVSSRVKRGVEAASRSPSPGATAPTPASAEVAAGDTGQVVAEPRPADDYKPSEREAVAKLIAQKSRRPPKSR